MKVKFKVKVKFKRSGSPLKGFNFKEILDRKANLEHKKNHTTGHLSNPTLKNGTLRYSEGPCESADNQKDSEPY